MNQSDKQEAPERIWIQPVEDTLLGLGPIWFTRRTSESDVEYARVTSVATVDRSLYSELIHIAAELVRADGFLSPYDDMPKRPALPRIAQAQDAKLKDWAYRVRQVANKLSAAITSITQDENICVCGHSRWDHWGWGHFACSHGDCGQFMSAIATPKDEP